MTSGELKHGYSDEQLFSAAKEAAHEMGLIPGPDVEKAFIGTSYCTPRRYVLADDEGHRLAGILLGDVLYYASRLRADCFAPSRGYKLVSLIGAGYYAYMCLVYIGIMPLAMHHGRLSFVDSSSYGVAGVAVLLIFAYISVACVFALLASRQARKWVARRNALMSIDIVIKSALHMLFVTLASAMSVFGQSGAVSWVDVFAEAMPTLVLLVGPPIALLFYFAREADWAE